MVKWQVGNVISSLYFFFVFLCCFFFCVDLFLDTEQALYRFVRIFPWCASTSRKKIFVVSWWNWRMISAEIQKLFWHSRLESLRALLEHTNTNNLQKDLPEHRVETSRFLYCSQWFSVNFYKSKFYLKYSSKSARWQSMAQGR